VCSVPDFIAHFLLLDRSKTFPVGFWLCPEREAAHSGTQSICLQICFSLCRLSGLENELLGLNSRVNAVLWSRSSAEIENVDVLCFGHLLFEMCAGYELASPAPSKAHLEVDLERYPQVNLDIDCANIDFARPLTSFCCIIHSVSRLRKSYK
jgi:hypothetical protein